MVAFVQNKRTVRGIFVRVLLLLSYMLVLVLLKTRNAGGCAWLTLLLAIAHQLAGHGVYAQALHLHEEVPFCLNRKRMGTTVKSTQEPPPHTWWVRTDQKDHSSTIVMGIVGTEDQRRDGVPGVLAEQRVCDHE